MTPSGCVPQQAYVPEVNGCVAAEGFGPGQSQLDAMVYDADTGEPLGTLGDLVGESATPSLTATSPGTPAPTGTPTP